MANSIKPNFAGEIGVLLTPERYEELIKIETNFKQDLHQRGLSVESIENDVKGTATLQPQGQFIYDDRPYAKLIDSKIKVSSILDKFMANPVLSEALSQIDVNKRNDIGKVWLPVTIYKCLYQNPDGDIWVRVKDQFDNNFKPVK